MNRTSHMSPGAESDATPVALNFEDWQDRG